MNKIKNRKLSIIIIAVVLVGGASFFFFESLEYLCHYSIFFVKSLTTDYSIRPENFPLVLQPPENALKQSYFSPATNDSASHSYGLTYSVRDPFPANSTLEYLKKRFSSFGFKKTKYNMILKASSDWQLSARGLKIWTGTWINYDKEEQIRVILEYPSDKYDMPDDILSVSIQFSEKGHWTNKFLKQYMEMHPDEFEPNGLLQGQRGSG